MELIGEWQWLLTPESEGWTKAEWFERGLTSAWWEKALASAWSVPMTDGPELDRWLVEQRPERVFRDGWRRRVFEGDEHLVCAQGTLRQAEIRQTGGKRYVEETEGTTTWIGAQIAKLIPEAQVYREWTPQGIQDLERRWPEWINLEQVWIGGGSDLMGDHWALLQGTAEQMIAATRGFVLARRLCGLESGVVVNAWFHRLSPRQAAILMPGALNRHLLLQLL
jgi:hypothetical protein